ncbi:uncharacterized protein K460DRAFT_91516 [Cucurbitaria berberidis CBS 394.84]|uniref:Uncharacterized protein n=1 Tax=Cucurbitaria berberidis CBS 394.84 TaxID=1168544 RepID=A0A9P4GQK9_9PLEO|nr:uncharacterized protein K460DRAFT_91516 [Cucurbitaria berberidis CBS 394.84]KAF1849475.1 hypothetical protein K460DRAFT_91516 [Cucurbitaria berberidis CBS 394.84]
MACISNAGKRYIAGCWAERLISVTSMITIDDKKQIWRKAKLADGVAQTPTDCKPWNPRRGGLRHKGCRTLCSFEAQVTVLPKRCLHSICICTVIYYLPPAAIDVVLQQCMLKVHVATHPACNAISSSLARSSSCSRLWQAVRPARQQTTVASLIPLLRNSSITTYLWVARSSSSMMGWKRKGSAVKRRRLAPA